MKRKPNSEYEKQVYGKYFNQNEINEIHNHGHGLNTEASIEEAMGQWVEAMKAEMQSGANPRSKKVQELMSHWVEMVDHLAGGDEKRRQAFNDLMHNEPQARKDHGIEDDLFYFMAKASGGH